MSSATQSSSGPHEQSQPTPLPSGNTSSAPNRVISIDSSSNTRASSSTPIPVASEHPTSPQCSVHANRAVDTPRESYHELPEVTLIHFPPGHPERGKVLLSFADALYQRYRASRSAKDLHAVIRVRTEALHAHPPGHPQRPKALLKLAIAFLTQYDVSQGFDDLDKGISLWAEGLALRPSNPPDPSLATHALADAYEKRYKLLGSSDDLHAVVELSRKTLQLHRPGHPNRANTLDHLAISLGRRYEDLSTAQDDVEEAALLHSEAVEICPLEHPDRPRFLHNFGSCLALRYSRLGRQRDDLEKAILLHSEALSSCSETHPHRGTYLFSLAEQLSRKYTLTCDRDDLEAVIRLHSEALALHPPRHHDHQRTLKSLASSLKTRYTLTRAPQDLDTAIHLCRTLLDSRPPGHSDRHISLNQLGIALHHRYYTTGDMTVLEEMIQLFTEALELTLPSSLRRGDALCSLANGVMARYRRTLNQDDLWRAIFLLTESLKLHSPEDLCREVPLRQLAGCLQCRFYITRDRADVDQAIALRREALALHPLRHRAHLTGILELGSDLLERFRQFASPEDLEEATALHTKVFDLFPPDSLDYETRALCLSLVATTLGARSEQEGTPIDHLRVLRLSRESLDLRPPGNTAHASSCRHFIHHLLQSFDKSVRDPDPRSLVPVVQILANGTPLDLSEETQTDPFTDLMFDILRSGSIDLTSPLMDALRCTDVWIQQARNWKHDSLGEAYTHAVGFLRRYLTMGPTVKKQYDALEGASTILELPMDAASHAISEGSEGVERAVEILDEGRSLLWSEMRRFREGLDWGPAWQSSSSDSLQLDRDLEQQYRAVCSELQDISTMELLSNPAQDIIKLSATSDALEGASLDALLPQKRKLMERYDALLEEIRSQPGMENFRRSWSFDVLKTAAKNGPVILVNCSEYGSHAIIIFDNHPPTLIPLDSHNDATFFYSQASRTHSDYIKARNEMESNRSENRSKLLGQKLAPVLQQLWRLVVEKVFDVLKGLVPKGSRVWWCPTSFLTILPFHAAGTGRTFFCDYYISSYTPTLKALIEARLQPTHGSSSLLAASSTPDILGVAEAEETSLSLVEELASLQTHAPSLKVLQGPDASRRNVLDHLRSYPWVHFMCHGTVDTVPFNSALHLHNGDRLTLNDIIKAHLPNAQFAFLAACHTAEQSTTGLRDEVLHLAAAVQFSGFRSVIGTMWAMKDSDGPEVADRFYAEMLVDTCWARMSRAFLRFVDGRAWVKRWTVPRVLVETLRYWADVDEHGAERPRHERSARAIWKVTQQMRKEGKGLERWVNFVHIGP